MAADIDALFLDELRVAREGDEIEWDMAGLSGAGGAHAALADAMRADRAARLSPASLAAAADAVRAGGLPGARAAVALRSATAALPVARAAAARDPAVCGALASLLRRPAPRAPAAAAALLFSALHGPAGVDQVPTSIARELLAAAAAVLPRLAEPALGCCDAASAALITIPLVMKKTDPAAANAAAADAAAAPGVAEGLLLLACERTAGKMADGAARGGRLPCPPLAS